MNFSRLSIKRNVEHNSSSEDFSNEYNNEYNSEYNKIKNNKTIIEDKIILIKTNNYSFEINYTKMKSGNEYFTIFNNNNQYCIIIKKDIENTNEIYLQYLNFFESCSKNKSLYRKIGTIEMLLCILQYIRNFYNIKLNYFFQDDSSINIAGHKLKLNLIYILLYGETWYMKNIHAIAISKEFNDNLLFINEYLDNNKDNIINFFKKSFANNENNISEIIISEKFIEILKNNISKKQIWKDIKDIYILSSSSRNFLQLLYKKYSMPLFLILDYYEYYQYITYKLKKMIYFESYMQIPNDFINNINIIINDS